MAKKAKKKKEETGKKDLKAREEGVTDGDAGRNNETGDENGKDDFTGDDLKQLDKALKEAGIGEKISEEEFKKLVKRYKE